MRYAINRDTSIAKVFEYDVIIVGAGLAGLYAALNVDKNLRCIILAKENMDCSSSWLAQGGIAAAINHDDTPQLHFDDTIRAGAGQCNMEAVSILVNEGPGDVETLVKLKVPFDMDEYGEFHFTREGGHNKRRVVHAGGDATGRETIRALSNIVAERGNITFSGHTCLFDILTDDGKVTGVVVRYRDSEFHIIHACNVIIATGGIGQLYKSSTNPPVATGDGIAAAMRAGAEITDVEFIQFHPTGLWDEERRGSEFLVSEAVRGEGGLLVNSDGKRFMLDKHELAELAPRDIVSRAIVRELDLSAASHVYIDITSKSEDFLKTRFPTIFNECLNHGVNMAYDKIPVTPIQHYLMGGIKTDTDGCTSIHGLYACGEAASTGVHGANRLASNSMLECLVFGRRAALHINRSISASASTGASPPALSTPSFLNLSPHPDSLSMPAPPLSSVFTSILARPHAVLDYAAIRATIQKLMSDYCYVIRSVKGLEYALEQIGILLAEIESVYDDSNEYVETLNIATVAQSIAHAAFGRSESIGSHYIEE